MTPREKRITLLQDVLRGHSVTLEQVIAKRGVKAVRSARRACYFALMQAGYSRPDVARFMDRDRKTIFHHTKELSK